MLNSTPKHIIHSNQLQKLNAEAKANIEKIKQERIAQLAKMRQQEMLKEVHAAANAQKDKPLNKPVDFKNIDKIMKQLANAKEGEELKPKALLKQLRTARTRATNLAEKNKSPPKGSPKSVTKKKPGRPRTKAVNATPKKRGRPPKPKAEPVLPNATPKRRGRPKKSVPVQQ
jgi:hypothetical protein